MTDQELRAEAINGNLGDEFQLAFVEERTQELITQFFQQYTIIGGGGGVHVIPGERYFLKADI